jgi:hypothetical protein
LRASDAKEEALFYIKVSYFKFIQLCIDILLFTNEEWSQDFGVCKMSSLQFNHANLGLWQHKPDDDARFEDIVEWQPEQQDV